MVDFASCSKVFRITALIAALVGTSIAISGCATEKPIDQATSSPTASTTTASPTPTPTATSAQPDPSAGEIAISAPCDVILSPEALAKTQPGLTATPNFTPSAGTIADQMKSYKGVACEWTDPRSGNKIVFATAHLGAQKLNSIKNDLASKTTKSVELSDDNSSGYFISNNGIGEAHIITSKYWMVLYSANFESAQRAALLASMAKLGLEWADKS